MKFQDIRYLRVAVDDLQEAKRFSGDLFGLQRSDENGSAARFRSDSRDYSLCFSSFDGGDAVALSVSDRDDLDTLESRLVTLGYRPRRLDEAEAEARGSRAVLAVEAPNGVTVELVWRPLTSGWRYHGPRDAGIVEFSGVQLACTDIAANEHLWTQGLGLRVSDWIGDAAFLALDEAHHRVALYPSERDGVLGATWAVESKDCLMVNWYALQKNQVEIMAGPDRQAASQAIYVTALGPGGLLMTYAAEMEEGPQIAARGPRQFAHGPGSHGVWGAPTKVPEFLTGIEQ